jgi:hypothetical protein
MLATGPAALAATGGDSNAGDVWVDTVGAPPGPGHEMDPHLPCANITVWGAKLADPSGSYVVDGWPPSGSQEQDYSSPWAYNTATGGTQAISTINITTLINTAAANGDKPAAQGYHFKLAVSQDPSKYKTFWVKCAPPTTSGSPTGSSPSPTGSSPSPTGTSPSTTGTSPSPTGNIPSTTGVRPNQPNRVPGTKKKTHHKKKHHPHLVPPPHRHHVKTTHIKKKLTTTAAFTG